MSALEVEKVEWLKYGVYLLRRIKVTLERNGY